MRTGFSSFLHIKNNKNPNQESNKKQKTPTHLTRTQRNTHLFIDAHLL